MANRVGFYFSKGDHSAIQTELKVYLTNIRRITIKTLIPKQIPIKLK